MPDLKQRTLEPEFSLRDAAVQAWRSMSNSVFPCSAGRKVLHFWVFSFLNCVPKHFSEMFEMFRCLGPGTVEEIVAREGEELISRFFENKCWKLFWGNLRTQEIHSFNSQGRGRGETVTRVGKVLAQILPGKTFVSKEPNIHLLYFKVFGGHISGAGNSGIRTEVGDDHHGDDLCEIGWYWGNWAQQIISGCPWWWWWDCPPTKLLSLGGGCLPHSSSSSTVGYNCLVIWKTNQHMCVL